MIRWASSGEPEPLRLSWRGRAAAAIFALNTLLLFFPPIPPYVKGSVWSYLLKTLVVVLAAWEAYRLAGPLASRWSALRTRDQWALGLAVPVALFAVALALRGTSPSLFDRFSTEVGAWETISTACYACAAVLLWRVGDTLEHAVRRHLRLVAAGFVVLLLEETDYAGIFGGLIGRIDGTYVGSLHDLITLGARGQLHPTVGIALGLIGAVATIWLWHRRYLQPRRIVGMLRSTDGFWLIAGLVVLAVAGAGEAGMIGGLFTAQSLEECIEMVGSLWLAVFALEVAGRSVPPRRPDVHRRGAPGPSRGRSARPKPHVSPRTKGDRRANFPR